MPRLDLALNARSSTAFRAILQTATLIPVLRFAKSPCRYVLLRVKTYHMSAAESASLLWNVRAWILVSPEEGQGFETERAEGG